MFQRILVALDCSDMGHSVFDTALALAKATDPTLLLIHVLSPLDAGYPTFTYPAADAVYPALHEEAMKRSMQEWEVFKRQGLEYLRDCTHTALGEGVAVDYRQTIGDPGPQVCDLARSWGADLIIVGRRGHHGLSELLLGSVSNYIMHHAPCSVLTVQGATLTETDGMATKQNLIALQ
jgi:nucleotide-binding universal stress UspA family protein